MDEAKRKLAREALLRMRVYRVFALVFVLCGMAVFIYLYLEHVDGNLNEALRRPSTVLILLLPFMPAFIFSWLASRAENAFMKVIGELGDPPESQ